MKTAVLYLILIFLVFAGRFFPYSGFFIPIVLVIPLLVEKDVRLGLSKFSGITAGILASVPFFPFLTSVFNLSVFLQAFFEEVFFRAYLQEKVIKKTGVHTGIVLTSLLFVVPHLINSFSLLSALTFFPSVIFGYLFFYFRSVWAPAVFHYFSNLFFIQNSDILTGVLG
ncbi:CPBP family glutamic-type intramembrane protease [Persephonella sp.]